MHMILNGFIDIMFYNPTTLLVLENQPVNQSYKLINIPTLIKISKNSIQEYLPLISGRSGGFKLNEEEYFNFSDNLALHELESPSFQ